MPCWSTSQCVTLACLWEVSAPKPGNVHRGADQWLFVASGRGMAIVEGVRRALRPGSLLLIERGERHEIRATGDAPLKTVNFYSPPAYTATGGERPAGRS